jgi:integrase
MGKYKHGKPNQETEPEELKEALEKGYFASPLMHKSYLAALYWIGARRTEPLEVKKEDVTLEADRLAIVIPAKKHGQRGGAVKLPLSWLGVELIKERWEKTRPGKKLWPFKTSTAYLIIKRIWPEKSPHWLRHNRITKLRRLRDEKKLGLDHIKSWTGIKSDRTIEGYGMKTQEKINEVADAMS